MKSAPVTSDEVERLKALYNYEVLDTEAEKVFDDLTQLASEICETPIALISLVDPNRQWFKSTVGIDAEETHRDIAFCAHAIHQREIFEVKDTLKDERFFDNPLVTDDPNIRFYAGTQLVTPDGHAIGTLCAISDQPKSLTAHQRNALEILGREVISQMELRLKVRQLKQTDQRKTDYLSNVSHELRTPLNAIICYSQLLQEKLPALSVPDEIKEFVNTIDSSSQHLLGLINSVLDLHKIEEGKMVLQPEVFDTHLFFQGLKGIIQPKATQKDVSLHLDIDESIMPALFMDVAKLRQILVNLLNNSVKFTEPHHHVLLEAQVTGNTLQFVVEDQGCGIAEQDLHKVFNKFAQVGNAAEGSGLGLVISKALTELMGGALQLDSKEGIGTKITLTFPVQSAELPIEGLPMDANQNMFRTDANILVVEDNLVNQQVVSWIFESLNLKIDIAETGEQAVELARNNPDVIFMDLHLPGIDGFEATQQILANSPDIPVIALSADAFAQTNEKALDAGMCDSLSKPIDKAQLIRILNRLVPK